MADNPTPTGKTEHAVVLSGGGGHGAYQIGVLRALVNERCAHLDGPIEPTIYAGTSTGAFNVAVLGSQQGTTAEALDRLQEIWLESIAQRPHSRRNGVFRFRCDPLPFLDPRELSQPLRPFLDLAGDGIFLGRGILERSAAFLRGNAPVLQRLLEFPDLSDLISIDPLRELVADAIAPEVIRRSPKKLRIAATHLNSGAPRVFENRDFDGEDALQAVLASTAIPIVFPPQRFGDDLYIDGATRMNTPLKPAIKARDDDTENLVLHVVYLDPMAEDIPHPAPPNSLAYIYRLYAILIAHAVNGDIEKACRINAEMRQHRMLSALATGATAKNAGVKKVLAGHRGERTRLRQRVGGKREVTIHRYRPQKALGTILGLLDFRQENLEQLIEMGYQDALHHDVEDAGDELARGTH